MAISGRQLQFVQGVDKTHGPIAVSYTHLDVYKRQLEGRGLGSAMVLEFLLYYMTKPEYQIHVREAIYLDAMLDLF